MILRRNLWIWPIIAVVVLSILGFAVRGTIERTMKHNLRSQLETLLNVEVAMLQTWFKVQESNAGTAAADRQTRETIYQLLDLEGDSAPGQETPQIAGLQRELEKELAPLMTAHDYVGYFVADKSKKIVAATQAMLIGQQEIPEYNEFLNRALTGETIITPPFPSVVTLKDAQGQLRTGVPTMYVIVPVRDVGFQVIGALALQIRPGQEFTRILQLGEFGSSGETYAFNHDGLMISNSRFDHEMILSGLLPDRPESRSLLSVLVRDPQGNIPAGYRPTVRRSELPLTRMAQAAISGENGCDIEGYRDYRGVQVVGAWKWLPNRMLGVASEIDSAEAYRPLLILKWTFWTLYGLLILSSIAIFIFTLVVSRLQHEARKATIEAQQLGQYTLEHKLGSGAMGVVYQGRHSMLRRPTAIKMLDVDKVNDASIQRFEREVQITCQLNHPNTIAIYDYGRTPDGVFYYAMEFLDGINLQTLVDQFGPQPEHRVIHLLGQVCGSLYEAHTQELVHRDIKPANIMINRRGAEPDVVKVLDFGLVKAADTVHTAAESTGNGLTGTPLYMSPEAIESPLSVDARSDLYAVGAVGYFLLTGHPVFEARGIVELCQRHVDEVPMPPSQRLGQPISPELEHVIMSCLEKSRSRRPQTARDLAIRLQNCPSAKNWTFDEAEAWWGRFERGQIAMSGALSGSSILGKSALGKSALGRSAWGKKSPASKTTAGDMERTFVDGRGHDG